MPSQQNILSLFFISFNQYDNRSLRSKAKGGKYGNQRKKRKHKNKGATRTGKHTKMPNTFHHHFYYHQDYHAEIIIIIKQCVEALVPSIWKVPSTRNLELSSRHII